MSTHLPTEGKKGRWKRVLLVLAGTVILLLGLLYGYYRSKIAMLQYDSGTLEQEGVVTEEETREDAAEMEDATADLEEEESIAAEGEVFSDRDVFNVLLIGTDERTKSFSTNARGDSCILVSINCKTMQVSLVSFERGMGVPILSGSYKGQWDWLTHTFRYGGAELMMQEIQECFKVDVNYYVRINIATFMQLIDCVGGVEIELTQVEADYINDWDRIGVHIFEMGVQDEVQQVRTGSNHLNGATAMVYARCRAIDNDWHRVERQRKVIQSVLEQSKSLGLLELNSLLDQVLPLVQTNLTEKEITNLLLLAPQLPKVTVQQMTIPVQGSYGSMTGMGGRKMFAVDFAQNAAILQQMLYGTGE